MAQTVPKVCKTFMSVIGTVNAGEFMAYLINGIPYDVVHALGNVTMAAWFGIWFSDVITQYQSMEEIEQTVVDGYVIGS